MQNRTKHQNKTKNKKTTTTVRNEQQKKAAAATTRELLSCTDLYTSVDDERRSIKCLPCKSPPSLNWNLKIVLIVQLYLYFVFTNTSQHSPTHNNNPGPPKNLYTHTHKTTGLEYFWMNYILNGLLLSLSKAAHFFVCSWLLFFRLPSNKFVVCLCD